ncbi:dATP/dGTP pyrophosphohydrolase domain-containing protein [Raoultella planticola]|uniref:dATP/dGTP pyrophosphohydrolase domain-containing protein n=2 Tax=Klebsiella/Raoultella group TaxID=2890311 RepID=UPI0021AFC42C|nr:dATP/dGTP pyrophosphohydrolase domain-containing protein [Raoultella planticola]
MKVPEGDYPLYRHAQLAPERDQVRNEHAEWSQATFGNVVPVGPLKHLSKEALEAVAEPDDLSEWADMQSLLWDAQRRAGITDEQITQAMIEKLVVNKQREWPEPKDEEPRLHIKEQPAPVVPGSWIPVSEQMPIEFEAVIAFDGDQVYGEAMYSSDDGFTIDGYEPCDRLNLQNVTHWMPLPAAPQEVKGEHQIRDEMDMGARITSHRFKV